MCGGDSHQIRSSRCWVKIRWSDESRTGAYIDVSRRQRKSPQSTSRHCRRKIRILFRIFVRHPVIAYCNHHVLHSYVIGHPAGSFVLRPSYFLLAESKAIPLGLLLSFTFDLTEAVLQTPRRRQPLRLRYKYQSTSFYSSTPSSTTNFHTCYDIDCHSDKNYR